MISVLPHHDYWPFIGSDGVDVSGRGSVGQQDYKIGDTRQKFTGKERDVETGLDYFNARYYSSPLGHFTSTDPMMASGRPIQPQSWNRYAYVLNNPLRLVDPTGMIDNDANQPRVVVVVFGGGHWAIESLSSSNSGGTSKSERLSPGGSTQGLGESSLGADAPKIAQHIKNDFPAAEVIFAGPDAKGDVLQGLKNDKPDNIIIYGYSRGGVMAVDLANDLTKNGQTVDQLTTVDPVCKCQMSDYKLDKPDMVKDAANFYEYPYDNPVKGAKNIAIGPNDRDPNKNPPTPVNHDNLDDITAPRVVDRVEQKLKEIYR